MLTPEQGRSIARMLLAVWGGMVVSWLGVAALVVLSILWPANQVPHVLLSVWLCAIVALQAWPGGRFRRRDVGLPLQIFCAPFDPMLLAGHRIWSALPGHAISAPGAGGLG
jgi:apolipoprotein N-acyltransferase